MNPKYSETILKNVKGSAFFQVQTAWADINVYLKYITVWQENYQEEFFERTHDLQLLLNVLHLQGTFSPHIPLPTKSKFSSLY